MIDLQEEENASFLLAETGGVNRPKSPLSVSEHLYKATLARNKVHEAKFIQAKLEKEIKEMEECTFQPSMATSGKNFSH